MHRPSHPASLAGLATVVLASSLDAQPEAPLPAPRQVETLSSRTDPHRAGALVGVTGVEVDLGAATTRAWPLDDVTGPMTLLGTTGSVVAGTEDVIKVCEQLCGDSGEECHYVARLAAGDLDRVGVPLAALPGVHTLSDYQGRSGDTGPGGHDDGCGREPLRRADLVRRVVGRDPLPDSGRRRTEPSSTTRGARAAGRRCRPGVAPCRAAAPSPACSVTVSRR